MDVHLRLLYYGASIRLREENRNCAGPEDYAILSSESSQKSTQVGTFREGLVFRYDPDGSNYQQV